MPWKESFIASAIMTLVLFGLCAFIIWVSHVLSWLMVTFGPTAVIGVLLAVIFAIGVGTARSSRRKI